MIGVHCGGLSPSGQVSLYINSNLHKHFSLQHEVKTEGLDFHCVCTVSVTVKYFNGLLCRLQSDLYPVIINFLVAFSLFSTEEINCQLVNSS